MNNLTIYNNPAFGDIRGTMKDGEPWFVGKDVATALGYSNPRDALAKHVDSEDKNTVANRDGTSGNPNMTVINESGLYALILSSKLPTAKDFKRWVTSEVLPAIRKTGEYSMSGPVVPVVPQRDLTVDDYLKAASIVSNCRNNRLPYVLYLLGLGGFSTPRIEATVETGRQVLPKKQRVSRAMHSQKSKVHTVPTVQEMACEFIRAVRDLGYTYESISQMTGAHRACICQYVHDDKRPGAERAQHIIDVLGEVLRQTMEAGAYERS